MSLCRQRKTDSTQVEEPRQRGKKEIVRSIFTEQIWRSREKQQAASSKRQSPISGGILARISRLSQSPAETRDLLTPVIMKLEIVDLVRPNSEEYEILLWLSIWLA